MDIDSARTVLDHVSKFQTEAEKVIRYEGNPFVDGDSIAEHLARGTRLITYIAPALRAEMPDEWAVVERTLVCFTVHDDEEIIDGFDVSTVVKDHNKDDEGEIAKFSRGVSALPHSLRMPLIYAFSSFRRKDSVPALIAKAIDNIVGNQLVIEQRVGLAKPDTARFCIEYAEKVRGASRTTDALVDAQIAQIIECRRKLRNEPDALEWLRLRLGFEDTAKLERLLDIDVTKHALDRSKAYTRIEDL